MNKIIKTVKKENTLFDSSALQRANANIEAYSPEELAHYGVLGMKWGVRKDRASGGLRSAHQKKLDNKRVSAIEKGTGLRSAHQKALDKKFVESVKKKNQKDEEKSLNKATNKAKSLASKKYLDIYNAMARDSSKFYSEINNKPEYKGKNLLNNKKYLDECAAASTKSLQQHSDRILGNKVDSRVSVKWYLPNGVDGFPSFYIERVDPDVKHSEDISDDRINLVAKFDSYGHVISLSLPEGAEDEFISDEEELAHYGVLGMKWGVRKGPSADTKVRRDRAKMHKNRRTMSNSDIKRAVNRMQMEKKLKTLVEEDIVPGRLAAKEFLLKSGAAFVGAAAGAAGSALVKSYLAKKGISGG